MPFPDKTIAVTGGRASFLTGPVTGSKAKQYAVFMSEFSKFSVYSGARITDGTKLVNLGTEAELRSLENIANLYVLPPDTITITGPYIVKANGSAVSVNAAGSAFTAKSTGDGSLSAAWYADNNGAKGAKLASAPSAAGIYWLGVSASAGKTSAAIPEVTKRFTISDDIKSGGTGTDAVKYTWAVDTGTVELTPTAALAEPVTAVVAQYDKNGKFVDDAMVTIPAGTQSAQCSIQELSGTRVCLFLLSQDDSFSPLNADIEMRA